jgi:hypothetical protein
MLQTRAKKNRLNFFYNLKLFTSLFFVCMLYAAAFQLPAQTLKQELNELPIITVDIASMDFPPNAHKTANGRVSGKAIETIKAFCIMARMKCKVFIYPSARAYMSIENNLNDVLLTANIPALESCCTYTKWNYPFLAGLITKLAIDDIPINETMLEGHSLVMVRGWQSILEVYPNLKDLVDAEKIELIETSSIAAAIKIYDSGKASLLWGSGYLSGILTNFLCNGGTKTLGLWLKALRVYGFPNKVNII